MLKGYGKVGAGLHTRLPIPVSIFERMCTNCVLVLDCEYIACMFKPMCTTAFYAFMRIGETTASKQASDVLQLGQVTKLSSITEAHLSSV